MALLDADGDGMLSFQEFQRYMVLLPSEPGRLATWLRALTASRARENTVLPVTFGVLVALLLGMPYQTTAEPRGMDDPSKSIPVPQRPPRGVSAGRCRQQCIGCACSLGSAWGRLPASAASGRSAVRPARAVGCRLADGPRPRAGCLD